jgi:hypothetical protein
MAYHPAASQTYPTQSYVPPNMPYQGGYPPQSQQMPTYPNPPYQYAANYQGTPQPSLPMPPSQQMPRQQLPPLQAPPASCTLFVLQRD